ncbi:uncharacterized protein LOC111392591 [Olea europaea var. sylvestris]|uniref:uncharacterized protein LOC111392591 n=1 Tax=Olea europaea var. sylvestris TaxID=158386 RepID=UPI000C1CE581|nr:uncharacterized protein LOC111392591 [Olea europaea var. sylvestris]
MDLDLALHVNEPLIPKESSTPEERSLYESWERSDYLSVSLIKTHARDFIKAIEEQFVNADKMLANTLMKRLSGMKFDNSKGVLEHIMEMRDIAARLKSLEIEIFKSYLVYLILNSLSTEYGPFKILYNI